MCQKCNAALMEVFPDIHFLWVILVLTAEGLTRQMGPLSSIMQVGNLLNLSIHLADF
jgi:hypothetical protein